MPTAQQLALSQPGYFKIEHVKGQELTYTIKDAAHREVGQDKEIKQVLCFEETPKELILNNARTSQLIQIFGSSEIKGRKVTLGVDTIDKREQIFLSDAEN